MKLFTTIRKHVLKRVIILLSVILSLLFLFVLKPHIITDFSYYTRPIWDSDPNQFNIIPHYYADNVPMENLCALHGWKKKEEVTNRVYDAIIFSVELDLLEIRIRELWDSVDMFVILESNATFTGNTKDYTFNDNRDRFEFAQSKIYHVMVEQHRLPPGEGPFYNEGQMRAHMNRALREAGIRQDDLLIMSDVDELVRGKTVDVINGCEGVPDILHLQLKNYLYSFEFYLDHGSWRAHIVKYKAEETYYSHQQVSTDLLSDSGWHCSFCFRFISDFQFKMQSYSHADRVRYQGLLKPEKIQKSICNGEDIFDMLPEAYSYREFISKWGPIQPSKSGVGLPAPLLVNSSRYKFLLPNGCLRDDYDTLNNNSL
ncbi:glycosyl transferase [Pilobolus umbonatus]|nr:glycosyl transferase [Pilobolus umbonatus]